MTKRILITNDDGIHSPALGILERELGKLGQVTVVAPTVEMSGQSHAITINRPIRYTEVGPNRFSVDGTPADCVIVARVRILKELPDLLVSGINRGLNLGDAILYSGTLAAASEGTLYGIPSIAVSREFRETMDYQPAAELTATLVRQMLIDGLPAGIVLNLNVPAEWDGTVTVTRQGEKVGNTVFVAEPHREGEDYVWLHEDAHRVSANLVADLPTDNDAIRLGSASLTALQLDRTASRYSTPLTRWVEVADDKPQRRKVR